MIAVGVTLELRAIQRYTRRFLIASTIVHAVFLFYLAWEQVMYPAEEGLTEVTWLEEDEIDSIIANAVAANKYIVAETSETVLRHFEREQATGDLAPAAQDIETFEDKVGDRLAALQQQATRRSSSRAALETRLPAERPSLAGVSGAAPSARPQRLVRKQSPTRGPVELKRTTPTIQRASVALPVAPEPQPVVEAAQHTEVAPRKVLAGISMSGPVADRPLLSYRKPTYPEWAKREAIEGSVNLYFVVEPDGTVKTNVMIQKTSGFEDFDRNATDALLAWRFEPLDGGATGEQWGTITFHYRLSYESRN
jgi:TonB family protein